MVLFWSRENSASANQRLVSAALKVALLAVLAASPWVVAVADAAPVGDALVRPALAVRAPHRAVLLAGAEAGTRIVAVGERGLIIVSDDGGRIWRQAIVPTSVTLTAVRFIDTKRGWAVGHGGVVLATTDSGEHWALQLDGRQLAQMVLKSARAGGVAIAVSEAERLVADGPDKPLLDLLLLGEGQLLAVGAYGIAVGSADGGKTWTSWMDRMDNPNGQHIYVARRRGDSVVLAGEQGLVLLSSDRGQSFKRIETPYRGSFFTAEWTSDRGIVLAGLRGNLLRSSDGGATWAALTNPMQASITASALTSDGLLLANQAGFVMALRGEQAVMLNTEPMPPLNGLLPYAGGTLAMTVQGVMLVPVSQGSLK